MYNVELWVREDKYGPGCGFTPKFIETIDGVTVSGPEWLRGKMLNQLPGYWRLVRRFKRADYDGDFSSEPSEYELGDGETLRKPITPS